MRGAHKLFDDLVEIDRIIPAYAGSTPATRVLGKNTRDHPRVCGEHVWPIIVWVVSAGSSPRMRGAHIHGAGTVWQSGIIPAYAGSTLWAVDGDMII